MKTKYIYLPIVALFLAITSCVGDLDVRPLAENVTSAEDAYATADGYTQALMKIYSVWAVGGQDGTDESDIEGVDAGNAQLLRSYFNLQVVSTDECKNAWGNDAWVPEVNNMTWSTTKLEPVEGVYQFSMFIVSLVNEFMRNIPNAPSGINQAQYAAEARFCRALAYSVLMDMFGRPPFITEDNYSLDPSQISRTELFDWIESELLDIVSDLPAARQGIYGRADQGAVYALLARNYLNAEVYTGQARYTECITACKNVIAGGYGLATIYEDLFKADNGQNSDTRQEIIFPVCFDGVATMTWGGMTSFICGSRGGSEVDLYRDGVSQGWDGYRSTNKLIEKFDFADPSNPTADNILDARGIFYSEGRSMYITTTPLGTFTTEGWAVYKYKNITSTGELGSNATHPDTDFPLFRLADIYLMYAESVARGGQGGDMATAVNYVNALRTRAGISTITESWLTTNNYQNILDERSRELYWEVTRRTDLIRFGLYTSSSYTWPFKGGVATGAGVDSRNNLFPIPVTDLTANGSLTQNDGY